MDQSPDRTPEKILVIKLGALGDIVQALGPLAAIRRHHSNARITIMTTAPYETFLLASGYVDEVWLDEKPGWSELRAWIDIRSRLRSAGFHRVYDLQTSDRSSFYYHLYWPGPMPEWSGIARGCSHPHANPGRDHMHTLDRQADQLLAAGIADVPLPDLSWADSDTSRFELNEPLCLIVPGGAPHRPRKRWPADLYAGLANTLMSSGVTPVLLGARGEVELMDVIAAACPGTRNLCGMTDFFDLVALARRAAVAIGNDTGPMHMLASSGCPCVVLFSDESAPALCTPRGNAVKTLQRKDLQSLAITEAIEAMQEIAPGLPPIKSGEV